MVLVRVPKRTKKIFCGGKKKSLFVSKKFITLKKKYLSKKGSKKVGSKNVASKKGYAKYVLKKKTTGKKAKKYAAWAKKVIALRKNVGSNFGVPPHARKSTKKSHSKKKSAKKSSTKKKTHTK